MKTHRLKTSNTPGTNIIDGINKEYCKHSYPTDSYKILSSFTIWRFHILFYTQSLTAQSKQSRRSSPTRQRNRKPRTQCNFPKLEEIARENNKAAYSYTKMVASCNVRSGCRHISYRCRQIHNINSSCWNRRDMKYIFRNIYGHPRAKRQIWWK